jgi:diguanylate cyclase (GGDEF)-like protein
MLSHNKHINTILIICISLIVVIYVVNSTVLYSSTMTFISQVKSIVPEKDMPLTVDDFVFTVQVSIFLLGGFILGLILVTLYLLAKEIRFIKLKKEEVFRLANSDPLTGLSNRRSLLDKLKKLQSNGSRAEIRAALIMVDLDDFKTINDQFGHDYGDELLLAVSRRLQNSVRTNDMVCRLGGDEFIVLVENIDLDNKSACLVAETIAEKIIKNLRAPYHIKTQKQLVVTASVGVTVFAGGEDTDAIMKEADLALYQAKHQRKNNVQFYQGNRLALAELGGS